MLKRFECKIGSGWTGFLNVLDDAIAQAWREDRRTDYFKDEFYFRPSADEVAPEMYHRLRVPSWYGNHPNTESKALFTENGYTQFQDDIERILKVYEAAGIPTRCLQSECPCGKLVSHGTYQRIYAVEG